MRGKTHKQGAAWLIFAAPFLATAMAIAMDWCLCSLRAVSGEHRMVNVASIVPDSSADLNGATFDASSWETPAPEVDAIIVPESEEWLLPIVTPLASKLRQGQRIPVLLAVPGEAAEETLELINRLSPRHCLVLGTSPDSAPAKQIKELTNLSMEVLSTGSCPTKAALRVAQRYWRRCKEVVAARRGDHRAVILGSLLAANLRVPFIPLDGDDSTTAVRRGLENLRAQKVLICLVEEDGRRIETDGLPADAEILDAQAIYRMLIQRLGVQNVRNIVLTRAPRGPPPQGDTAWLAPYLSLIRDAPAVLCDSADGKDAEERVKALVRQHSLKPRSVTILADYNSIGVIALRDQETLEEYEVEVEPCAGPGEGGAAAFGVGRIPHDSMAEASLFIARGIAREQLIGPAASRVLLIANPSTDYSQLPLCETISRATAKEFENLGVTIDEFYGKPTDDPDIRESAENADLIIYEGHISDQRLFEAPPFVPDPESYEFYDGNEDRSATNCFDLPEDRELDLGEPSSEETSYEMAGMSGVETGGWQQGQSSREFFLEEQTFRNEPFDNHHSAPDLQLHGLPVFVLQSCHSLEEWLAMRVFQSGGIGVIGTTTNVHSASGSAFIKAFCDGLLYRGDTVGEALRDARNYFLCLADLKARRGHAEQAKVRRAALSFRLWGDPEMRIPGLSVNSPVISPVSARFVEGRAILVQTPARRLQECRTEKYFVRMFPGSELAGVVRRLREKPERRLMPMYFFRLAKPAGFSPEECATISCLEDTSPRAACLSDSLHNWIYIVYFPETVETRDGFVLRFGHTPAETGVHLSPEGIEDAQTPQAGLGSSRNARLGRRGLHYDAIGNRAEQPPAPW